MFKFLMNVSIVFIDHIIRDTPSNQIREDAKTPKRTDPEIKGWEAQESKDT